MIIECINCNKKFSVNSELIPDNGRNIQCGSCNHLWFFKKNTQIENTQNKTKVNENTEIEINPEKPTKNYLKKSPKKLNIKRDSSALIKYNKKTSFTLYDFLSLLLVIIISFIGLLILIDTFKNPLYEMFPRLEFLFFNLYETFKDISSFLINLFF